MNLKQKIFNALSPLVSVDGLGNKCCYPATLPQQPVFPAIVYQITSAVPAALTQSAHFTDFVVLVTIYAADDVGLETLRASVLGAAEAMPEYKTHAEIGDGYEFEPKTYSWKINFEFRNTET